MRCLFLPNDVKNQLNNDASSRATEFEKKEGAARFSMPNGERIKEFDFFANAA
jgi:hypothetical protein